MRRRSTLAAAQARVAELPAVRGLPLEVRESLRARRLRLEARPGLLRVTLPAGCPAEVVARFVEDQAAWIAERTRAWQGLARPGEGPVDPPLAPGESTAHLLFRGLRTPLRVSLHKGGRPRIEGTAGEGLEVVLPARWEIGEREARGRRALARWYDTLLRGEAEAAIDAWGRPRQLVPREIRFSQPRTRWGSCARNGIVRLNRRLVGAPTDVFRYVVLHEIAHLRHPDHSARFWSLVAEMDPAWRTHRRWLAEHGVALG